MLKFYNTLTRKKDTFKPLKGNEVRMYNCGPTVYNYAHIGNFRAYMCSDILRRYLEYKGYKVLQIMNITDVDDKTIRDSQKEGISLKKFTEKYNKAFFEDLETLNIKKAEVFPKATEHIKEMVALIEKLKKGGYTYETDGSIYFKISTFKNYGKLAKIKVDELQSSARIDSDEYEKESANDFALWKGWTKDDGDVSWETSLGKGRPGWHIECSAMSMKYLGETFDIHTGGKDLIFPHHENEIAQSEAATGKPFVKFWLHNEYILVDGKKMSKKLGNFYTLRDLIKKGYNPKAIRYLLLSSHYRQPLNFTLDGVDAADNAIERLMDFMAKLKSYKLGDNNQQVKKLIKKCGNDFEKAMDDDLNMSSALASIFEFVKEINKLLADKKMSHKDAGDIIKFMMKLDTVLGVLEAKEEVLDKDIDALIQERENARKDKNFKKADKIRDNLKAQGIILEDTPQGVRWKRA